MRPEELSALTLDADLVVLSACATALSGGHAGDEGLRGLVAPLIEAGARGVAATLWAVDDDAQRRSDAPLLSAARPRGDDGGGTPRCEAGGDP